MIDLGWMHAVVGILGAGAGAVGGIFVGGYRVGKTEGRLALSIKTSEIKMEEKLEATVRDFGETLLGIRQKINDVELDTERRFLQKGEFDDFRKEYREDMRDLKFMIKKNGTAPNERA